MKGFSAALLKPIESLSLSFIHFFFPHLFFKSVPVPALICVIRVEQEMWLRPAVWFVAINWLESE